MRIIAGEKRSLKLVAPLGLSTRPTQDKIKETLFNILAPYIYADSKVLDLFSGSGALGLEALSRGAKKAVFVENSKEAAACIEKNIKTCAYESKSRIIQKDAVSAMRILEGSETFDLIFMDPPYGKGLEEDALRYLALSGLLEKEHIIVLETERECESDYLEELGFEAFRIKEYKNNKHVFIRKK
ncbi:MAG: 16S rRNA (guanine(966)-N(2))-methyltransferase RsmD [Lachnospiraceae bacterium]|nr:16S rRNA (guanine(966)-N(2))-methyltransferase RsmD [Lachnospiraceae bacterium]